MANGLNSTLVQFKLRDMSANYKMAKMSQFHFGSIQTNRRETFTKLQMNKVSIPLWFNSNIEEVTGRISDFMSQFHFGSIQTE